MLKNINVFTHSSIKFNKNKIIYFDPYNIDKLYNDADIIFITHSHYDHYSIDDLKKIITPNTKLIIPSSMKESVQQLNIIFKEVVYVESNMEYEIDDIKFWTIPSYNVNKQFHPKNNNWLGYIIMIDNIKYYIAGDTDITLENLNVKCDVAFIPIGGIYTMNYVEGANLINKIKPKVVIPTHYGSVVGEKEDALKFKNLINKEIKCELMIK